MLDPIAFSLWIIFFFLLFSDTCCLYFLSIHVPYNFVTSFCLCFSPGLLLSWKWFLLAKQWFLLNCTATLVFHYPRNQFPLIPKTVLSLCACRSLHINVLNDLWTDVLSPVYYVALLITELGFLNGSLNFPLLFPCFCSYASH